MIMMDTDMEMDMEMEGSSGHTGDYILHYSVWPLYDMYCMVWHGMAEYMPTFINIYHTAGTQTPVLYSTLLYYYYYYGKALLLLRVFHFGFPFPPPPSLPLCTKILKYLPTSPIWV